MATSPPFKIAARLAGSIGLTLVFFLGTMAIPHGATRLLWILPGKLLAPAIAAVAPQSWVVGDPTAENYWRVASTGGFVILCGMLFWAAAIFALWQWHSVKSAKRGSAGA